jgi:GNAT superfamily N-acetyltransferase
MPEYRRRGISSALLNQVLVVKNEQTTLYLDTENDFLISLIRGLGFVKLEGPVEAIRTRDTTSRPVEWDLPKYQGDANLKFFERLPLEAAVTTAVTALAQALVVQP